MSAAVVTAENAPSHVAVFRHELDGMADQFAAALPAHIPAERFTRVLMTAAQNNQDLFKCDRRSLWNAAMKAAQDGLLPDGREGAIIPYGKQAQWIPMVAGLRKKARNSGEIATWECHVVYENDDFDYLLGDDERIYHRPALSNRGKAIAAYSIAVLKSGEKSREVMSFEEIEEVRKCSRAPNAGPWAKHWGEMARKTVARRHSKVLPMSTDLDDLIRRDDDLYDFEGAREDARASESVRPRTLAGRLDRLAIAADNQEVGPQIDAEPESGPVYDEPMPQEPADLSQTIADLDNMLAEAAKKGTGALEAAWAKVPKEHQQTLKSALDRRHKPTAAEVDAGKAQTAEELL